MTTISLIIPAYNNLESVLRCVQSMLASAGAPVQPLIQDDASPNVNYVGLFPPSVVERNPFNGGFAFNCNQGAKRARGDVLVFCNQDVVALPGWSDNWALHLADAFADPQIGIVGARLLFPETNAIQSAGGLFDARCTPFHRCLGYSNPHDPEVSEARDVSWLTGAWLAIRRDLFERVGGFSLDYSPSYFEDVDLAGKVAELGYRVRYEPRLTFQHAVGSTGGSPHFLRSAMTFKRKWVDSGKVTPDVQAVYARYW